MCENKADYFTSSPDIYVLLKENARKNRLNMTDAENCYGNILNRGLVLTDFAVNISLEITSLILHVWQTIWLLK